MAHTFQQEYMEMPPITRAYTTACVLTTIAVVGLSYLFFCSKFCFQTVKQKNILTRVPLILRSQTKPQHLLFHFVVGVKQNREKYWRGWLQLDWLQTMRLQVMISLVIDCKSCKIETDLTQKQYDFNCNKGSKLEQNYDRLF